VPGIDAIDTIGPRKAIVNSPPADGGKTKASTEENQRGPIIAHAR